MSEHQMPLKSKANNIFNLILYSKTTIFFSCRMPPKKCKYTKTCQFCGETDNHIKRHLLMAHLPWYMSPISSCVDCQISEGRGSQLVHYHERHQRIAGDWFLQAWFLLMNGVFLFMAQEFGLGNLQDLLVLVASVDTPPTSLSFSDEEYFFLREYDRRAGLQPLAIDGYMAFPPVRLIALTHYKLMAAILPKLSIAARIAFKSVFRYANLNGSSPPLRHPRLNMGIIDSHFHMDSLSNDLLTPQQGLKNSMTSEVSLLFGIANYVYPSRWSAIRYHMGADPKLKFTLGIHPHIITMDNYQSQYFKLERKLEACPEALGIGEIGLDHTTTCRCNERHNMALCVEDKKKAQLLFLSLCFQLAKRLDKVIVIHVRDNHTGKAAEKCLETLKKSGLREARIHRHCFVGGEKEYKNWCKDLPNCLFSISNASLKDKDTKALLSVLESPDRLMIETDAPYLATEPVSVYDIAVELTGYFNMSTSEIIRVCNRNVAKLYNLPW